MESETQKTTASDATLSNSLKRKADHCDGTDCSSPPSKLRDRLIPGNDIPVELLTEKYVCIKCSQRIALADEKGFTFAHWFAHSLVCDQSRLSCSADQGDGAKSGNTQEMVALPSSDSDTKTQTITPMEFVIYLNAKKDAIFQKLPPNTREKVNSNSNLPFVTINHAVSVPEKRRRPNRTEAERKEELLTDPNVAEVEPYRILCAMCDKWIKLRKNSRYCSIPWDCHKGTCQKTTRLHKATAVSAPDPQTQHGDLRTTVPTLASSYVLPSQAPRSTISHSSLTVSHPTDLMLPPASSHPSLKIYTDTPSKMSAKSGSMSPNGRLLYEPTISIPRLDAEQRRMALEADPHSEIVEHDRVLCLLCKRWVKLRQNSAYCSTPWRIHIARCANRNETHESSGSGSNDAITDLKREDTMANDALATAESHAPIGIKHEILKSSYYRNNHIGTLHPAKGELKVSYYKDPVSLSTAPRRKPRENQLKVKAPEPSPDHTVDTSESEASYESEEA